MTELHSRQIYDIQPSMELHAPSLSIDAKPLTSPQPILKDGTGRIQKDAFFVIHEDATKFQSYTPSFGQLDPVKKGFFQTLTYHIRRATSSETPPTKWRYQ